MLDIKVIRSNPDILKKALLKRKDSFDVNQILSLDEKRRQILVEVEQLKNKQNSDSKMVPIYKKEGKDVAPLMEEMKNLSDKIKTLDYQVRDIDEELNKILLTIPNIPNSTVPDGDTDDDNVEIRKWGDPKKFVFEPKAHWDIGERLGILDFAAGSKVDRKSTRLNSSH